MGQQQILFLILGVCMVGIAVSVGVIAVQNYDVTDHREVLITKMYDLAARAQTYYRTPADKGGGGGSFLLLNLMPQGIERLTKKPPTLHGDFFIKKTGYSTCTQIVGAGLERGRDPRYPVRVMMTVWAESTVVSILN